MPKKTDINRDSETTPEAPDAQMRAALSRDIIGQQLERLARTQRRRLVADLVNKLGAKRLEMAEDVVQDAVLAAMRTWPFKGMPDNPAAWLNRVARNKAYDRLRREGREQSITQDDGTDVLPVGMPLGVSEHADAADTAHGKLFGARVDDPELKLIFLCCHSALNEEDRLMLTLKVVSGFTARDIASLFLKKDDAVGQRLARVKRKLRALDEAGPNKSTLGELSRFEVRERLNTVLKVIYLMFAVGYAPRRGEALILHDVAREALRLAEVVAAAAETKTPAASALAALLNLQASRLDARMGTDGMLVLLQDQNRSRWDRTLIDRGMLHLKAAGVGEHISRYHIEAGIAAAHASAPHFCATDWQGMCVLYAALEAMTHSPIVSASACVAEAFAGAPEKAFLKLEALAQDEQLAAYAPYHIARGEVLRMLDRPKEAAESFKAALGCDASAPVMAHLKDRLASCL